MALPEALPVGDPLLEPGLAEAPLVPDLEGGQLASLHQAIDRGHIHVKSLGDFIDRQIGGPPGLSCIVWTHDVNHA